MRFFFEALVIMEKRDINATFAFTTLQWIAIIAIKGKEDHRLYQFSKILNKNHSYITGN